MKNKEILKKEAKVEEAICSISEYVGTPKEDLICLN